MTTKQPTMTGKQDQLIPTAPTLPDALLEVRLASVSMSERLVPSEPIMNGSRELHTSCTFEFCKT